MVRIRSRFCNDVHLRTKGMAIFGGITAIGVVNFLDAINTGSGDPGSFLTLSIQEAVDIAAHRTLAVQSDIQSSENVIQSIDAALEKSCRTHRSGSDFKKTADVPAIDRQVSGLVRIQSSAARTRGGVNGRARAIDLDGLLRGGHG